MKNLQMFNLHLHLFGQKQLLLEPTYTLFLNRISGHTCLLQGSKYMRDFLLTLLFDLQGKTLLLASGNRTS